MPAKLASTKQTIAILDHKRAVNSYVCVAVVDSDGKPSIERIARITAVFPADGAGKLRLAVTDWGPAEAPFEDGARQYVVQASGYGYDKLTAALSGTSVGGVELGDHCDSYGRKTLDALCQQKGWEWIKGW
jgi:hypothetical protein